MRSGKKPFPLDDAFLLAMEKGMPPSAGIAMALIDHHVVFNKTCIDDVVAFPFSS